MKRTPRTAHVAVCRSLTVAAFAVTMPGRNLVADRRHRLRRRVEAFLDQAGRDRDHPVAAHRAVALVVHEQHGHVGVVAVRRQQDRAVHVAMAARLVHERAADVIGVLLHPLAALQDGQHGHVREATADEAQRLAGGVQVHRLDRQPCLRARPFRDHHGLIIGGSSAAVRATTGVSAEAT